MPPEPEVYEDLAPLLGAFDDLQYTRAAGERPGAIAPRDVLAWLEAHGIEGEEREEWFDLLMAMDRAWMAWAREREGAADADARRRRRRA